MQRNCIFPGRYAPLTYYEDVYIRIWVSFRENEPSLYIYGSVSEKMSLRYIYIKVIKIIHV